MSGFRVTISGVRSAGESTGDVASDLKNVESRIEAVISALNLDGSVQETIRKKLRTEMSNVNEESRKLQVMANVLRTIAGLYESTENSILGADGSASGTEQAIQEIASYIADLAERCGLDPSGVYAGDPVNLCTGNFVYDKTCIELDASKQMRFRIFYNIQNREKGILGTGWTHNWEIRLNFADGVVNMMGEDASLTSFREEKGHSFTPMAGSYGTLERKEYGYVLITRDRMSYRFDDSGRLFSTGDDSGILAELQYGEDGRLQCVESRSGGGFLFSYGEDGKLESVSDGTGRCVLFEYEKGQVVSVRDAAGRLSGFHYDKEGRLVALIGAKENIVLKNEYDKNDRTVCQTMADGGVITYEYRDLESQVLMTEQNGNTIIYEHDGRLRNIRNCYADGEESYTYNDRDQRTSFTDKRGNISFYKYDEQGNLAEFKNALNDFIQIAYTERNQVECVSVNGTELYRAVFNERHLQESCQNALGERDFYEYDKNGQPVKWTRADGSEVYLSYDGSGNLVSITNTMGGCTEYSYDSRQRMVCVTDALGNRTEYEYNDVDEVILIRNAEGNCRKFEYDVCGNLIRMQDYNGAMTEISYNEMNKPCAVRDCEGNETKYEYDLCQNMVRRVAADGGITSWEYNPQHRLKSVTDAVGNTNYMEYDGCGNLIRRTDPNGAVYQITYDALNRAEQVINPMGLTRKVKYDAFGNEIEIIWEDGSAERFTYDLAGRVISRTDRMGWTTKYTYSPLGKLCRTEDEQGILEIYEYYPGGLLKRYEKADGSFRRFEYDQNENIIRVEDQNGGGWSFAYDCLGRVICADQEDGILEYYEYDPLGNILAVTDGEGVRKEYGYSKGGDLTCVRDGRGYETRYEYDVCHRLTRILQPENSFFEAEEWNAVQAESRWKCIASWQYDREGRVTVKEDAERKRTLYTWDGCGNILSQTDPDEMTTCCAYNPDGTRKAVSFADGRSLKMSYDERGRMTQMEDWLGITRIVFDAESRPVIVTDHRNQVIGYEWGSRGECLGVSYPDGRTISYQYDRGGRLSRTEAGLDIVTCEYEPNGLLKQKNLPGGISSRYGYNRAGELTELSHFNQDGVLDSLTFDYDRAGRKVKGTHFRRGMSIEEAFAYHYDGNGSLSAVERNGLLSEKYEYDASGNRISAWRRGSSVRYEYNQLNQLTALTEGAKKYTFTYDVRGNLTEEYINNYKVRTWRYGSLDMLEEAHADGVTAEYEYNGLLQRTRRLVTDAQGGQRSQSFVYEIPESINRLLSVEEDGSWKNLIWDQGLLGVSEQMGTSYYLNDERMTPCWQMSASGEVQASAMYDSFGVVLSHEGNFGTENGFTGFYLNDSVSGFCHAGFRNYVPEWGRFTGQDPFLASAVLPLSLNAYLYCVNDPVNRIDPTGAIAAWLAGGIVGAAVNVATKLAGDVVNSVAAGEIKMSSWQSYVGTVAGGFATGSILMTGHVSTAGAVGSAVETAITEGLSVWTGADGYTAADGYNLGTFTGKLAFSTATGALATSMFSSAAKYVKIPGINSGQGSFQSVWKQMVTKSSRKIIQNVYKETVLKGIVAYGGVRFLDQLLKKGGKKAVTSLIEAVTGYDISDVDVTEIITQLTSNLSGTSSQGSSASDYLSSNLLANVNCALG